MKNTFLLLLMLLVNIQVCFSQQDHLFLDQTKSTQERINDMIGKMTLEEKVSQLVYNSPEIERLGIPAYNWWNECLHGVARSGVATVFPQAIGLGATFDQDLMFRIATAISDEARAMYNAAVKKGYRMQYGGLTFWTPNINIFRDPRWGRGQETYGEDPYLMGLLGSSLVKGLQGDDPQYLKVAACAKHFAVHSGPEKLRHQFNAEANMKDMHETYLPAFKALVDAGVESVMCAYNATNGEPCCANDYLLNTVLRKDWQFQGHVVSDCWALVDFYQDGHNVVANEVEAAALALKHGVNLNCGSVYPALTQAVQQGLVTEEEIDEKLAVLLKSRFKLGLFDDMNSHPYNNIPVDVINSDKHRTLAREAAQKSIVMLKNNGVLPLQNDLAKYFVTGPNAADIVPLLGNYYGVNTNFVTILEGLASNVEPGSQIEFRQGILLDRPNTNPHDWSTGSAKESDATFYVMGITGLLEGEEGEAIASLNYGDRLDYNLPANQIEYLKKLKEDNPKPVIAIVTGGSPMNLAEVHEIADAVLLIWYPGQEGGSAVADIVFGKTAPSGKLPVTFPKSLDQLPPYEDYAMTGRTYRYMEKEPLYPFGFGLSYNEFVFSDIRLSATRIRKNQSVNVTALVTNNGQIAGDEVVQLYMTDTKASVKVPLYELKGIKRIHLKPGESQEISFTIDAEMMKMVNDKGEKILEPGEFKVFIGGSLPGNRSAELGASKVAEAIFTVR